MAEGKPLKIVPKGPPKPLPAGTVVDARYRVVRVVGQGGAGIVYEVEHLRTGQHLALKTVLEPEHGARLEQEAKAAGKLRSRHAIKVIDLGKTPELGPYIVMNLLVGQSLRELLGETKQLAPRTVANVALQVAECLDEAHGLGLIHRDLKPDNIHLSPMGSEEGVYDVTVLDFGVVKVQDDKDAGLTKTGSTVGTPYYMSLEQLRGSDAVDARSDVYSLAVVLYECLAGTLPFIASNLGDLVYAICSTPPVDLNVVRPDLPREMTTPIMRGLSSKPKERPASMRELVEPMANLAEAAFSLWLRSAGRPARESSADLSTVPIRTTDVLNRIEQETVKPAEPTPEVPAPKPSSSGAVPPPTSSRPGGVKLVPPASARVPKLTPPSEAKAKLPPRPPARDTGGQTEPPPSFGAPLFGAGPSESARPVAPTFGSPQGPAVEAPPEKENEGDRDTPTEMYVPKEHGIVGVRLPSDPPELSTDIMMSPSGQFPQSPVDPQEATAVLDISAAYPERAAEERTSFPPIEPPTEVQQPGPTSGYAFVPPPVSSQSGFSVARMSHANIESGERPVPSSMQALDKVLADLGSSGNQLGTMFLMRFRHATAGQQAAVVAIGAAAGAIIVVLFIYAVFL